MKQVRDSRRRSITVKWVKRLAWAAGIYMLFDAVYVLKSAYGFDLLPAQFGHHGWMFVGSDWAVSKLERKPSPPSK